MADSGEIIEETALAADVAAFGRIDVVPKILEVICRSTGMGFAAVARVTGERWIACAVRDEIAFGLVPGGELELRTTICDEVRCSGEAVVIDHVAADPHWREHDTPRQYGFQSYISTPIMLRGEMFGTLCAIDPKPARLDTPETRGMFELFADLIATHLDTEERLGRSEQALLDAAETAELREQFIAVLGHDLRNPLAAVDAGLRLIGKTPLTDRAQWLVAQSAASVSRMAGLIDNILDFARGRLGGGFYIDRREAPEVRKALEQVIAEIRTTHPDRTLVADLNVPQSMFGDPRRLAQLLSNLIANAITHGSPDTPVEVEARAVADQFELAVTNRGPPIPAEAMGKLFQPFTRASVQPHQAGLGLGLHIAAEIARAHEGELTVTSDAERTRFIFRAPLG